MFFGHEDEGAIVLATLEWLFHTGAAAPALSERYLSIILFGDEPLHGFSPSSSKLASRACSGLRGLDWYFP